MSASGARTNTRARSWPIRSPARSTPGSGRERGKPSNILLAANYLNPPEILLVDLDAYHGATGELIRMAAYDPIEVVAVRVAIRTGDGQPVESGDATNDHGAWTYRTTAAVPAGKPWQVEIVASNRAEQTDTVVRNQAAR